MTRAQKIFLGVWIVWGVMCLGYGIYSINPQAIVAGVLIVVMYSLLYKLKSEGAKGFW